MKMVRYALDGGGYEVVPKMRAWKIVRALQRISDDGIDDECYGRKFRSTAMPAELFADIMENALFDKVTLNREWWQVSASWHSVIGEVKNFAIFDGEKQSGLCTVIGFDSSEQHLVVATYPMVTKLYTLLEEGRKYNEEEGEENDT